VFYKNLHDQQSGLYFSSLTVLSSPQNFHFGERINSILIKMTIPFAAKISFSRLPLPFPKTTSFCGNFQFCSIEVLALERTGTERHSNFETKNPFILEQVKTDLLKT